MYNDSERWDEIKAMMIRSGIQPPEDFKPTDVSNAGKDPYTLNEILAGWCNQRFINPLKAVEALQKGEDLEEAAASLFWYCYSWLDDFTGEGWSFFRKLWKIGRERPLKSIDSQQFQLLSDLKYQLSEVEETFTLDHITCQLEEAPTVHVLAGAALLILYSRNKRARADTRNLITQLYELVGHTPVGGVAGEGNNRLEIGMHPLAVEATTDGESHLSGSVVGFLAMLACIVVWDSYTELAFRAKEYKEYDDWLTDRIKILEFWSTTLRDSMDDVGIDVPDSFCKLPYSNTELGFDYGDRILERWEQVKHTIRTAKIWKEMGEHLSQLSCFLEPQTPVLDAERLEDEIRLCRQLAEDRPATGADIERLRNEERQRIMLKQFFPRGLASRFEKETQRLINEMVTEWLGRRFHTMITSMRKVLENGIIATLPFLRFTIQKEKGDPRLVLTKIADAVINDTKEVNKSIDLMVDLMQFTERKHYKKWLKGKLPSFLKEVVYVRNFFEKEDGPGVSKQKKRDMEAKSDELYRRFFGIGCEGVFPVLMELKARSRRE